MKIPKVLQRSEHDEQRDLFAWTLIAPLAIRPEVAMMFAIPNFAGHHGSQISRIVSGKRAKEEGRKAGVPDVFLPVPRGGFHGLFLEMKRADGSISDCTPEQDLWADALDGRGYRVIVTLGFEHARDEILEYLNL